MKKVEKNLKKMGKRVDETTIPWYNIHRKREPIPAERSARLRFFRIQKKGISFEEMKFFNSEDVLDVSAEGLCVSGSPQGLDGGLDGGSMFGGAWDAYDDDDGEIVIMEGRIISKIYDGYRIRPTREIARFTKKQWAEMLETGDAWDYEDYE